MSAGAETQFENATAVVVFGLDDAGKPHASAFAADEAGLAEKAAGLMGMRLLRLEADEQRALAAKLPRGRVFAGSGKAFVPFVAKPLYESLAAFGGVQVGHQPGDPETACTASPGASAGTSGGEGASKLPASLDEVEVGSVVLACVGPAEGWYESVVIRIDGDDLVTMKWRDYPKDRMFARRRSQLALLPHEPAVG